MPPLINRRDLKQVRLSAPFTNKNGSKSTFVNYETDRGKLSFCMHPDRVPFGPNTTDPSGQPVVNRFNMAVSVEHPDNLAGLKALDSAIVDLFHKNAAEFWPKRNKRKKLTREDVLAMYRPIVVPSSDPSLYSPLARTKLDDDPERPTKRTRVYLVSTDKDGQSVYQPNGSINKITRNSEVILVCAVTCAWFLGGNIQFGVTLKVESVLVYPSKVDGGDWPFVMPEGREAPTKVVEEPDRVAAPPASSAVDDSLSADELVEALANHAEAPVAKRQKTKA
jgi:hypothetical protein